ncbi:MAG: UvrD-helicase domain-containing protein, partial [Prevotella sp.]|nr:UvrD-helicase domain-containing protein [Prevotella sp.]
HIMGRLTVYKASAGSGKTFTLASRYIGLLVSNPSAYKEILAVTFTTKATAEMKNRILSQLYGLSHSLAESDVYLQSIKSATGFSEGYIRSQAGRALGFILHDYGNFNIETIDSFFQRVLRSIARELELNANMRVELGQNEVEELAVDRLITSLTAKDVALKWIMDYIRLNISEEKSRDVITGIKSFGRKIYTSQYMDNSAEIDRVMSDEGFFARFTSRLRAIMTGAEQMMRERGDGFFAILSGHGYDINDLANKASGVAGYFLKLQAGNFTDDGKLIGKNVAKAMESVDGWVTKGKRSGALSSLAENELLPYLKETEQLRIKISTDYRSARAILAHINEVRLLKRIELGVEEINKETNSIMLTDTQTLLRGLMEGSDAPFIYEKTGGRIRHIMIDEMQDTSVIQWSNFKKLLLECLSHAENDNLIVGDIKQSIYRWRNSDWSILGNITADSDLAGKEITIQTLDTNYRSDVNIIRFNNEFFRLATRAESLRLNDAGNPNAETILNIYPDNETQQRFASDKKTSGGVELRLLADKDYDERSCNLIAERIKELLDKGAKEDDIAIITRTNGSLVKIGEAMQTLLPDNHFVSDEAFKLRSSVALDIIMNALRFLAGRQADYFGALLAWEYCVHIRHADPYELRLHGTDDIIPHLPNGFAATRERLKALPLQSLAEEICRLFGVHKLENETAYIDAFFDYLSAFARTNIPEINAFIDYWEETMSEKTVKGGDIPGIRMMTIHKSKGLEFDHVIIPYCDWEMDKGNTLWCKTDIEPYCEMPVVPVDSKQLDGTVWQKDCYDEAFNNTVDNLNLLYVAFTRAKSSLLVIGRRAVTKDGISYKRRSGLLETVLPQMAETLSGYTFSEEANGGNGTNLHFVYGGVSVPTSAERISVNIFTPKREKLAVDMRVPDGRVAFRQSNRSRQFVCGEDGVENNQRYINEGTILHALLAQIHEAGDTERVLREFVEEGVLTGSGLTDDRVRLANLIRSRIEANKNPLVNEWFVAGAEVLNECTILAPDPATGQVCRLRPDRIVKQGNRLTVIDFKFARPREEYKEQVRGYMRLLRSMGHSDVNGYLWFVYKNIVCKVEEEEELCSHS